MSSETVPPNSPRLGVFHQRRAERVALAPCRCCGGPDTAVVSRTDYVLYIRCANCWEVWSVSKPGRAEWS
jgi:hypothetical protein